MVIIPLASTPTPDAIQVGWGGQNELVQPSGPIAHKLSSDPPHASQLPVPNTGSRQSVRLVFSCSLLL